MFAHRDTTAFAPATVAVATVKKSIVQLNSTSFTIMTAFRPLSSTSSQHRIDIDQWRSTVPALTLSGDEANRALLSSSSSSSNSVPFITQSLPSALDQPPKCQWPKHRQPIPLAQPVQSLQQRPYRPRQLTALASHSSFSSVDSQDLRKSPSEGSAGSAAVHERCGKKEEADRLVDSTIDLLLSIWPASSECSVSSSEDNEAIPLRTFVNEILRRSRSNCGTLRAARWYLERAQSLLSTPGAKQGTLGCPRRTFLSSLVLAQKFLHDRVYSNKAWKKLSGLEIQEISTGETELGNLLSWSLWVGRDSVSQSTQVVDCVSPANIQDALYAIAAPPLISLEIKASEVDSQDSDEDEDAPSLSTGDGSSSSEDELLRTPSSGQTFIDGPRRGGGGATWPRGKCAGKRRAPDNEIEAEWKRARWEMGCA
ncbi:Cyclin [Phaffia rhodozyma]|uniref:Cyclin n=1 Tax=Phaffia rhodozyma TaxID=264483 RepID=A0A0F7SXH0_PHARH|nr:Cyclin [Phaffia rhodozyma]